MREGTFKIPNLTVSEKKQTCIEMNYSHRTVSNFVPTQIKAINYKQSFWLIIDLLLDGRDEMCTEEIKTVAGWVTICRRGKHNWMGRE